MNPPLPRAETADKAVLRRRMRAVWRAADLPGVSAAVTARLLELPEAAGARHVAAYAGMPDEVDTAALVDVLRARGAQILLPVVEADASLSWRVALPGIALVAGPRGTREPPPDAPSARLADADLVVVPGLAFDQAGRRLGRGGGSYDRALADPGVTALRVALAPDAAVLPVVPAAAHDEAVHIVVTPTRTIRVRA